MSNFDLSVNNVVVLYIEMYISLYLSFFLHISSKVFSSPIKGFVV